MSGNLAILKQLNTGDIKSYIQSVMSIPVLEEHEEKSLLSAYFDNNDLNAVEKLIIHHLKLVVKMAYKYSFNYQNISDLIQAGNIGLMKSIKGFNHAINVRLSAYAYTHIKSEILEFLINNHKICKIATTKAQRKVFFNYSKVNRLKTDTTKSLTYAEYKKVADELSVSVDDVIDMDIKMSEYDYSIEQKFDWESDLDSDNHSMYVNGIIDGETLKYDIEHDDYEETIDYVKLCISKLDARKQDIINSRYFSESPSTLSDLSKKYNISMERVRQLEADAISKIKSLCEGFNL